MKKSAIKILLMILGLFVGKVGFSQTYDVYIANRALPTDTTMEFDVFIKSNGATGDWALRTYQCGYQFSSGFVNGGSLKGAYISGSSALTESSFGKTWGFTWNAANKVLNQSANTGNVCPGATVGTTARKIGRFRVTNSAHWGCANDSITMRTSGSGFLLLAVTKWGSLDCTDATGYTVTSGATPYSKTPNESLLAANISGSLTTVCYGGTTSLTVSGSGGVLPYTGTGTVSRGAGSQSFTITDARGCSTSVSTVVSQPSQITSSFSASNCGSYSLPWGGTVTSSGAYSHTYTSAAGCDSVVTANVTINTSSSSSFSAFACSSYSLPWGGSVTSSGSYEHTYVTASGCDSIVTANVTIGGSATSESASVCSSALPYSWNGNNYSAAGSYTDTLTSSGGCDSIVVLNLTVNGPTTSMSDTALCGVSSYTWNGTTYTASGLYTYSTTNAAGCDSFAYLKVTFSTVALTATAASTVTQTLVLNDCGYRVYRYTASAVPNATGWAWTLPASFQGGTVTLDSGYADFSQVIKVAYSSSAAAAIGDSIKVRPYNGCSSGLNKAYKLSNVLLSVPAAPTVVAKPLVTNICGNRTVRYTGSALKAATATTTAATGWEWVLPTGAVGSTCVIDSGTINSQTIVVKYISNAKSLTDTVKLAYTSSCGNSLQAKSAVVLAALTVPATPTITAQTVVVNVCGARVVRYTASAPKVAGASSAASTGYSWVLPVGVIGSTCVLDSGSLETGAGDPNDSARAIKVRFLSNAKASLDTVKVAYLSDCGNSLQAKSAVALAALTVPAAPTVTATVVASNVCGARIVRYSASAPKAATATAGASTGYEWVLPVGTIGSTCVLDSGSLTGADARYIRVKYVSNAKSNLDTIKALYTSDCGNSPQVKVAVVLAALTTPAAPATVTITSVATQICGARVYRYTAPNLVGATATAGAATGWEWDFVGTLGDNATIDSGDYNTQSIKVIYTSNAAALIGDSVKVRYLSVCGAGAWKAQKLSNLVLNAPAAPATVTITLVSDVCGNRVYRYTAPNLVGSTATAGAATGWEWSFVGTLGLNASIDSGDLNSQVVRMVYTNNGAAAIGDSAKVRYLSNCGSGAWKAQKLSNLAKAGCPPSAGNLPVTRTNPAVQTELLDAVVFPNPTTSSFKLKVQSSDNDGMVQVRVLDIQGREFKRTRMMPGEVITLGSELRAGTYLVEIRQGNKTKISKLIKL